MSSRKRLLLPVCLLGLFALSVALEPVPHALSEAAVPSLVLLGTAKGGTTDLWHMIHRVHKGFCSYDPRTSKTVGQQYPEHIQTKKELDFFSQGLDSVCSGTSGNVCSAADMRVLLRCPNDLINLWVEERKRSADKVNVVAARCQEWLAVHRIGMYIE